ASVVLPLPSIPSMATSLAWAFSAATSVSPQQGMQPGRQVPAAREYRIGDVPQALQDAVACRALGHHPYRVQSVTSLEIGDLVQVGRCRDNELPDSLAPGRERV